MLPFPETARNILCHFRGSLHFPIEIASLLLRSPCGAPASSTLVTVVACRGAINVAAYVRVLLVCTCFGVRAGRRVAGDATELGVVCRDHMAIRTNRRRTPWWVRKLEKGMVEDRTQPGCGHPGRVAGEAGGRIIRRDVIRHACAISLSVSEIHLMAAVAICGWVAGRIVPAEVAVCAGVDHRPDRARDRGAGRQHMGSLQRKPSRAVIKLSIRPENSVMAS